MCSLDTFPYAGTTTTCESLYMGVPCVSMAGLVHAHNVGVTLLHQVGKCQTSILDLIICKVRGVDNPFAPFVTQSSDVFVHM